MHDSEDDTKRSPLSWALDSLEGLSVGDAFGEQFFGLPEVVEPRINERITPAGPWPFTDDTMMALSVVHILRTHGGIDPEALAIDFARRYDRTRGYGPSMHQLLADVRVAPGLWSELAQRQIGGAGSWGNGSAMRAAPIGAFFADDPVSAAEHALHSSVTTHTHPEGIAGAVATAVAASVAASSRGQDPPTPCEFLGSVLAHVPRSVVRDGIRKAQDMPPGTSVRHAAAVLGNGVKISCPDTVPFALWSAGKCLDNYEEALWITVSALGDRDTTCAIVGGIVAARVGVVGIPDVWRVSREPLPEWHRTAEDIQ